jgi:hypothetical protein
MCSLDTFGINVHTTPINDPILISYFNSIRKTIELVGSIVNHDRYECMINQVTSLKDRE